MKTPIRILLVDDQYWVRGTMAAALNAAGDLQVVAEAEDYAAALRLFGELEPDVLALDMGSPTTQGAEAIRVIRRHYPWAKVLALSRFMLNEDVCQAQMAGALACLSKGAAPDELQAAIRAVGEGKKCFPSGLRGAEDRG